MNQEQFISMMEQKSATVRDMATGLFETMPVPGADLCLLTAFAFIGAAHTAGHPEVADLLRARLGGGSVVTLSAIMMQIIEDRYKDYLPPKK